MTDAQYTEEGMRQIERVTRYLSMMRHIKGEWAGQRFRLLPWQFEEVIVPFFGTLNPDGTRRYRICYVEIPKKNGKTEFAGALANYFLTSDGENSPEVYSAAGDKEQASLVYQAASQMVRMTPELKFLQVRDSKKRISNPRNNGYYQVLSSESFTKHGLNPSCVIFDELHAQPDDELWNILTSGTDYARRQQAIFVLTTAGVYDVNSIWWKVRTKARQIRDGVIKQDNFLPVLYIADPDKDDPDDEALWSRVNPALGRIFTLDKIRSDYQEAKQDPTTWANFLRFRLNIPIRQVTKWMPMEAWDKCTKVYTEEELLKQPCCGGLDISSKLDLSAFVLVFPPFKEREEYAVLCRFYCPQGMIAERRRTDRVNYDDWVANGFIEATQGDVVDQAYIERDIIEARDKFDLIEVGYDPSGATYLATRLNENEGIPMIDMSQSFRSLNEPMKDVLVKAKQGLLAHGGHPVLRWNADNVVVQQNKDEYVRPSKGEAVDRIDGFVALVMALGRAVYYEENRGGDVTIF